MLYEPDPRSPERSIENILDLYTGYSSTLCDTYKLSDKSKDILKSRWDIINGSDGQQVFEKFRDIAAHQHQRDYETEYSLRTRFLEDFIAPSLEQVKANVETPIPKRLIDVIDAKEYFQILNKVADYVNRDKKEELYLFMDIARLLPDNFIKARGFIESYAENPTESAIMLMWGFLSGTIKQKDDWAKQLGDPNNPGPLYKKAKERVDEIKSKLK